MGALPASGALATAMRAVELLESDGDSPRRAFALAYAGLLLVAIDRYGESLPLADAAVAMARRLRAAGLEALELALRGGSRLMLGDDEGLVELEAGVNGRGRPGPRHRHVGYVLAVEDLWALGRFADVERFVEAASPTPGSATSGSTWNTSRPIGSACLRCAATGPAPKTG